MSYFGEIRPCAVPTAKFICSSQHLFEADIRNPKRLFFYNNSPIWFFDKICNKFKAKFDGIPIAEIIVVNDAE